MSCSIFTFTYNAISQGYPVLECLYSLLPLGDEIVIVDCGSNDGTRELLQGLTVNPNIRLYDDSWVMGLGGRNYRKSASLCHSLCKYDTIIFAEADEIWPEELVLKSYIELSKGFNNLKFSRYQITQNFQRIFWYPERGQIVHRVFPRNSSIMQGGDTDIFIQDTDDAKKSVLIEAPCIVDCRNNFRDNYLCREETSKIIWSETDRKTTRFAPAHAAYNWEISYEQLQKELQDDRWLSTYTIINVPNILKYHLGRTKYEVRDYVVNKIKNWCPNGPNNQENIRPPS